MLSTMLARTIPVVPYVYDNPSGNLGHPCPTTTQHHVLHQVQPHEDALDRLHIIEIFVRSGTQSFVPPANDIDSNRAERFSSADNMLFLLRRVYKTP